MNAIAVLYKAFFTISLSRVYIFNSDKPLSKITVEDLSLYLIVTV